MICYSPPKIGTTITSSNTVNHLNPMWLREVVIILFCEDLLIRHTLSNLFHQFFFVLCYLIKSIFSTWIKYSYMNHDEYVCVSVYRRFERKILLFIKIWWKILERYYFLFLHTLSGSQIVTTSKCIYIDRHADANVLQGSEGNDDETGNF